MRITKEAEERKNEILDVAESMFVMKGYDNTSISDLLETMNIARGTLYYHYKSKEEILDGIISRRGTLATAAAEKIIDNSELSPIEKLLQFIMSLGPTDKQQEQLFNHLETTKNTQLFQKSLTEIISRIAPLGAKIIEEGNQKGVFNTQYPLETVEMLLAIGHTLFDNGELNLTEKEKQQKFIAFIFNAERMLGTKENTLLHFVLSLQQQEENKNEE